MATIYTIEKLSPNQELTPEGFLLCRNVAIARTGWLVYGAEEVNIPAKDGIVKIHRNDESIFNANTINSITGKPITITHPNDDVTPFSWKEKSVGVALNVRRGDGDYSGHLLADLLIQDIRGIEAVKKGGFTEISVGYDAQVDYDDEVPGIGEQREIIVNHVALVKEGRCGASCSIRDHKLNEKEDNKMARNRNREAAGKKTAVKRFIDLLMRARDSGGDEDEMKRIKAEALDAIGEIDDPLNYQDDLSGDKHIHIHTGDEGGADLEEHVKQNAAEHAEFKAAIEALTHEVASLKEQLAGNKQSVNNDDEHEEYEEEFFDDEENLEEFLDEELEKEEVKEAIKTKDARYLKNAFQDAISKAEIIAPGIKTPKFDKKASISSVAHNLVSVRRKALDSAYSNRDTRGHIDGLLRGKEFESAKLSNAEIGVMFASVAQFKANHNNQFRDKKTETTHISDSARKITTIAELNAFNQKVYSK